MSYKQFPNWQRAKKIMLRMATEQAAKNTWNTVMRDMLDLGEKYIISLSYHSIYLKQ